MGTGWTFDERSGAGEEHVDPELVARYDDKMPFDPADEIELLRDHGLSTTETVIDLGTGTGQFAVAVAPHCDRVLAVDISPAMLDVVRLKADRYGVGNIEPIKEGFLSYDHRGPPAGFAFSKDALHHLPDFWKVEALKTVGRALEAGGIFRLRDFVYSFEIQDSTDMIEDWIAEMQETTQFSAGEIHRHFRDEFSTYGFLLEAMLEAAGFDILEATYDGAFYAAYTCQWPGKPE